MATPSGQHLAAGAAAPADVRLEDLRKAFGGIEACADLLSADIAEKVLWLLSQDRATMGRQARARVQEKWDVRVLTDRHLAVYDELVARRKRS